MNGGGSGSGGVLGAFFFAIAAVLLFVLSFNIFLMAPFLVFVGGFIAMVVSDRNRGRKRAVESKPEPGDTNPPRASA